MADQAVQTPKLESRKTEKIGEVVSTKMAKTIVVEVGRRVPHPLYKRIISKRKKFYAHDETGQAKMGDIVRIIECRPLSKTKRWTLGEVIRQAVQVGVEATALETAPDFGKPATKKSKPTKKGSK